MNHSLGDVLREDSVMEILDGFHESYATDPDPYNETGELEDMRGSSSAALAREVCTQCSCLMSFDPDKKILSCCGVTIHALGAETGQDIDPDTIYTHIFSEQSSEFDE